jgi:hypothetical protein
MILHIAGDFKSKVCIATSDEIFWVTLLGVCTNIITVPYRRKTRPNITFSLNVTRSNTFFPVTHKNSF